jgi:hypothetical protein
MNNQKGGLYAVERNEESYFIDGTNGFWISLVSGLRLYTNMAR